MFKFPAFLALTLSCVACGASFTAHEDTGGAGESSGGLASSAGAFSVGAGGDVSVGGSSAAGESSNAGAGGWGRGGWGNWGNGGRGNWMGTGGASPECATLGEQYVAAVDKARACDKGSTDQCSPSSVAQPVGGCGCPVLINSKSEAGMAAQKAYQAYQDANCDRGGPVCDIFCPPATEASCEQPSGTGNSFVCSASTTAQK
ncbi:MAG TPA: hypothetical protein VFK05_14120 [Polyangiaceae bacterium]|nr:hypothetical protein [Polyangiaceae bacterium]